MKIKILIMIVLSVLLIAACAQASPTLSQGTGEPTQPVVASPGGLTPYPPPTQGIVIPNPEPTPTLGAYPGPTPSDGSQGDTSLATQAAIKLASDKYKIPADQFKVVRVESVVWRDGCLEVVIPGVMCTEALVDGYRIILDANGQQFEIRSNLDGRNVVDAAQLQGTLQFVVYSADGTIQVVNPSIALGPTYSPSFNNFLSAGASIAGTAYVDDAMNSRVMAINADGANQLAFIEKPTYGLAFWRGADASASKIAWGTQVTDDAHPSSLMASNLDGSGLETLLTLEAGATIPQSLVAEFWSTDGQSLYFSKEPVGLGGYILYWGASNLFKIDVTTKEVTEIIPASADTAPQVCMDAISLDLRYVADHCNQGVITIRDLQGGSSVTLEPPTDITGASLMGSARFSPDGKLVAYALAVGNPDSEQSWVAVGESTGGGSKAILTGSANSYYTVAGWLDDQTILVQKIALGCSTCVNELFTVGLDGSEATKVAEGSFLAVIDNR